MAKTTRIMTKEEREQKAAVEAAKIIFGDRLIEEKVVTLAGTLVFDVDLRKGKSYEKDNPQKARPWSLVQVLLSKLNSVIGEAAVEKWLAEGIKTAQYLDEDHEKAAKERVDAAIEKLLPTIKEKRAGNVTVRRVAVTFTEPEKKEEAA